MSNYSELLKDPRWQKKRLEILQRDGFCCRECFSEKKTLHVHHIKYIGDNPWDVPNEYLLTMCADCHELEENLKGFDFYSLMRESGLTRGSMRQLIEIVCKRVNQERHEHTTPTDAFEFGALASLIRDMKEIKEYAQKIH